MYRTDGENAGAPIHGADEFDRRNRRARRRHAADLDAARLEVEPREDVGREVVGRQHDIVAIAPREPVGRQRQAMGCVGGESDTFGRCTDQVAGHRSHSRHLLAPLGRRHQRPIEMRLRQFDHGVANRPRDRPGGGVIEEDARFGYREVAPDGGHVGERIGHAVD